MLGAGCLSNAPAGYSGPQEAVTVAWSPFESTALFWVAEDQHFFEQNGINLSLRKYESGAGALDGVMNGEADIAVGVTEFPLVRKAFQNATVRTLATVDKGDFTYLVARKDRGIAKAADLRGKRVGSTFGTIVEFHLARYLALNGLTPRDLTLVNVKTPDGWVNDVAEGRLDAIATAQPYANEARDRLGENGVSWSVQSRQPLFALAVAPDAWIEQHPGTARRFIRSLSQAEDFTTSHPSEAQAIVQQRLNLSASYMPVVWQQNQFSLTLDQSLITAMEDEARWMIANNQTNATAVPDFRNYISPKILEEIKPGSVRIIG
jgi:NitT/TauT family transport system substrate-binding protein